MLRFYLTVLLMLLISSPSDASADTAGTTKVTIVSGGHRHVFNLELADTPQEQERGLMFRTQLPADGGMLFTYHPPRPVYMWMRNTLIPLDMIFVRPRGTIGFIEYAAEPLTEQPRGAHSDMRAVLELPGGTARRLGIKVGDYVDYAILEK